MLVEVKQCTADKKRKNKQSKVHSYSVLL